MPLGKTFNFDEVFLRDLTICVLDTLEGRITWTNRFTGQDIHVKVPFYYSLAGDERFLFDSFSDDIVSNNRFTELNADQIPRAHVTLTSFTMDSSDFRNPNVWLKTIVEKKDEIRSVLKQVRAIPITAQYDITIFLKTEIDTMKCSQAIMNTIWLYKFMYFEYNYININAIMTLPDAQTIEIPREKDLTSDNTISIKFQLQVQTFYPAFYDEDGVNEAVPMRTKWYNNLYLNKSVSPKSDSPFNEGNYLSQNLGK